MDGLAGREVLLVIDNCEHVLDDIAALVEALAALSGGAGVGDQSRVVGGRWGVGVAGAVTDR